jgi:hypothetical protein
LTVDKNRDAFNAFAAVLSQTGLPGTADRRFVRKLFRAVNKCKYLQKESQDKPHRIAKEKIRPVVKQCDDLLKKLRQIQADCSSLRKLTWTLYASHLQDQFSAIDKACEQISHSIKFTRERTVAEIHPHFRKSSEKVQWENLIGHYVYDYPFKKFGWKPAETWLEQELNAIIAKHLKNTSPKQNCQLIQAVFRHGLEETKTLKAIEVALHRNNSARKHPR